MRIRQTREEYDLESRLEYRKWTKEIPNIQFPRTWEVRIIPPFAGAIVRFLVNDDISVYLDCYDRLGCVGQPYWEIYPAAGGDTERFMMNDTAELIAGISKAIRWKNKR